MSFFPMSVPPQELAEVLGVGLIGPVQRGEDTSAEPSLLCQRLWEQPSNSRSAVNSRENLLYKAASCLA